MKFFYSKVYYVFIRGLLCFLLVILPFINVAYVPSASMSPTLNEKSIHIIEKSWCLKNKFKYRDIIVFQPSPEVSERYFIKRICCMPGEVVKVNDVEYYIPKEGDKAQYNNGWAIINGHVVGEWYGFINYYCDYNDGVWIVKEDTFFVMGDNRDNSLDSRYWGHRYVPRSKIKGKLII